MDALERLRHGIPQHPDNKKVLRKAGKVAITVASVAREANRSRALISYDGCRYPAVRQAVLAEAGVPGVEPGNREDVLADLRAQVSQLRRDLAIARDEAAHHLKMRNTAEKRLAGREQECERLRKQLDRADKQIQRADQTGKVIQMFPEQGDAEQT
jgi:hypothetical protein